MPTEKADKPKPTAASENLSEGQGSIEDIQDVAQDAAEGHPPPVKPQSATAKVEQAVEEPDKNSSRRVG